MFRKPALVALGTSVAVLGVAFSGVATSQVGTLDTGCASGTTCVWKSSSFGGDKKIIGNSPDQQWINLDGSFNDNIESMKNQFTNRKFQYATGFNGSGSIDCKNANSNTSQLFFPFANNISSYRVGQAGSSCP